LLVDMVVKEDVLLTNDVLLKEDGLLKEDVVEEIGYCCSKRKK
jgi:hypothetical protein